MKGTPKDAPVNLRELQSRVDCLHGTLSTLILWLSGSCVSPINHNEARRLLEMADGRVAKKPKAGA